MNSIVFESKVRGSGDMVPDGLVMNDVWCNGINSQSTKNNFV